MPLMSLSVKCQSGARVSPGRRKDDGACPTWLFCHSAFCNYLFKRPGGPKVVAAGVRVGSEGRTPPLGAAPGPRPGRAPDAGPVWLGGRGLGGGDARHPVHGQRLLRPAHPRPHLVRRGYPLKREVLSRVHHTAHPREAEDVGGGGGALEVSGGGGGRGRGRNSTAP